MLPLIDEEDILLPARLYCQIPTTADTEQRTKQLTKRRALQQHLPGFYHAFVYAWSVL